MRLVATKDAVSGTDKRTWSASCQFNRRRPQLSPEACKSPSAVTLTSSVTIAKKGAERTILMSAAVERVGQTIASQQGESNTKQKSQPAAFLVTLCSSVYGTTVEGTKPCNTRLKQIIIISVEHSKCIAELVPMSGQIRIQIAREVLDEPQRNCSKDADRTPHLIEWRTPRKRSQETTLNTGGSVFRLYGSLLWRSQLSIVITHDGLVLAKGILPMTCICSSQTTDFCPVIFANPVQYGHLSLEFVHQYGLIRWIRRNIVEVVCKCMRHSNSTLRV